MIRISNYIHNTFKYPAGEVEVNVTKLHTVTGATSITFDYRGNNDIFELLLACNAIKHCGDKINSLYINYLPYGRQDRVNEFGGSFSLEVFANMINTIGADKVYIKDPHSDVTPALIKNSFVIHQHDILKPFFHNRRDFFLVSPDGGALKKIYKLAKEVKCCGVVECSKLRNTSTGEITNTVVHHDNFEGKDCYIVDDICDGGGTFIEIAKKLRELNCGRVILVVTHGLFTKGMDVFKGVIDEIITKDGVITDHTEDNQ